MATQPTEHFPFPNDEQHYAETATPTHQETPNFVAREIFIRRSESIAELAKSLARAQLSFTSIRKSVENTFYTTEKKKAMYADLAAVIAATQKALAENGLVVIQSPVIRPETKEAGTRTLLAHVSGEWIENEVLLPATAKFKEYTGNIFSWKLKFDAQTCGIAITYSRRYSYQSIIGVAAEEDDDGNSIGEAATPVTTKQAQDIGKKKVEEIKKAKGDDPVPCLFYTHHKESNTYSISGSQSMREANWPLLKRFWNSTSGTIALDGEQLEALKYELETRNVPFRALKAS